MKKWRKRGPKIVLMEDRNEYGDGGDWDETSPGRGDVGIGMCGDENWLGGVGVVVVGCSSEADAVEDAFDTFF